MTTWVCCLPGPDRTRYSVRSKTEPRAVGFGQGLADSESHTRLRLININTHVNETAYGARVASLLGGAGQWARTSYLNRHNT